MSSLHARACASLDISTCNRCRSVIMIVVIHLYSMVHGPNVMHIVLYDNELTIMAKNRNPLAKFTMCISLSVIWHWKEFQKEWVLCTFSSCSQPPSCVYIQGWLNLFESKTQIWPPAISCHQVTARARLARLEAPAFRNGLLTKPCHMLH